MSPPELLQKLLQDTGDIRLTPFSRRQKHSSKSSGSSSSHEQHQLFSDTPYCSMSEGDDSDDEGTGELPGTGHAGRKSRRSSLTEKSQDAQARAFAGKVLRLCGDLVPWLLAWLIGVLTALTGSYISVNCDYLGDSRFGVCQGKMFSDRSRCCGGADNINFSEDRCVAPLRTSDPDLDMGVEWVPWESFFTSHEAGSFAVSFVVYLVASLIYSGTAACLVHEYSPAARGSGIPEVKAAVSGYDLPKHFLGITLLVKTVGLSLVVGAGLSLGKEGPLIHIGVCWAYVVRRAVARLLASIGLPADAVPLHELACVGAAAGVSTAFGAPLGGVLFAAEELGSVRALSRRALMFSFMSAFSASFTLKWLNLYGANKLTMFALSTPTDDPDKEWVTWEIIPFLFLGVTGGLIGALFVKMNLSAARSRRRYRRQGRLWLIPVWVQDKVLSKLPACFLQCCVKGPIPADPSQKAAIPLDPLSLNVTEAVVIAFVTAILNFPITRLLRMLSPEAIHALFETCPHSRGVNFGLCDHNENHGFNVGWSINVSLFVAAVIRLLQTTFTFGAALPSGLFIPSLFIGATIGRLVGNGMLLMSASLGIWSQEKSNVEPGVYAMVGAISTLTGFARMTVSLVVIMFELTGELTYIVPFMCAVLASKLTGDMFTPSIYDGHSVFNGLACIEEPEDVRLENLVSDVAVSAKILDVTTPLSLIALQNLLREAGAEGSKTENIVLVLPASDTIRGLPKVIGVIERNRLGAWANRQVEYTQPDTLCDFSSAADRDDRADVAAQPATSTPRFHSGNGVEDHSQLEARAVNPAHQGQTRDAGHLVDTHIAKLSSHAPLLTAHCTFSQRPRVKFCVCINDRCVPPRLTLLSREAFDAAMIEERFPLSRPVLPENVTTPGGLTGLSTSIRDTMNRWSHPGDSEPVSPRLPNPLVVGARDIELQDETPAMYSARKSSDRVEAPSEHPSPRSTEKSEGSSITREG